MHIANTIVWSRLFFTRLGLEAFQQVGYIQF